MRASNFLPSKGTLFALSAAFVSFFLGCVSPATAQRLTQSVLPSHYTLTLTPDLKAATFSGIETIDVIVMAANTTITLNSAEIAFQSVSVAAGGKEQAAAVTLDKDNEQATFTFPEALPAGPATLSIHFTGILNNELRGFYLSKTARRNYAVTQFEATDARRAFPCFDEPAMKATYDISLVVDSADTAISNSPIESDVPGPETGKHTLKFATTPKMSTYLVAFLVGDFQCTAGRQDGVDLRVCSTPDKVELTHYGVDVAKFALHYYNQYFGIPYPLKKLDLIAVPDFEAGAMENFGAITYRETALLIDPATASVGAKKEVALVIAHEMAHQWFGDLVTMQWWDNLWLNEGFATWMENKPVAAMHPEWNIDQTVVADMDSTLLLDAQPTTRAIRAKADTPDEINQMFDGISYGKAGAVLLSVENYLGEETFRQGVHNYLVAHRYANATAEDFWNAQTSASHKPVDKIMESLVAQPGEPILTFGDPADGSVAVTQKRFFLSPGIQPDPKQKWTLPVCFKAGNSKPAGEPTRLVHLGASPSHAPNAKRPATVAAIGNPIGQVCEVLIPGESTMRVPASSLFFANAGGKGYYRTAYTPTQYASLVAGVETALTPGERISLIGDEWVQVRANKSTIGAFLDLVGAAKADPNAIVISAALGGVGAAYTRIAATSEEHERLSAWIRATFAPQFAKLGAPANSDSPNTRELRAQLFGLLGYYGKDPAILDQAREIAEQYLAVPGSVDATLGQTALYIAARNGDAALFDRLQKIAETSANPEFQATALRLLATFQDPVLVQRSLDYAVSGKVRNQDAVNQIAIALSIDENRDQAWEYIRDNWNRVQGQFTTGMGARLISATGGFCTVEARDEVRNFYATHKVPSSDKSLTHAIEHIDGCIELRALQEPNLKQWLAAQPKP